jgi:class 3 adenylate cyclase
VEDPRATRRDSRTFSGEGGMEIDAWLSGLGLEEYAPAFRDNDIDAAVLPELTAEDLIAIGVNSVGHRRKLLAAIAALRDEPSLAGERSAAAPKDCGQDHAGTSASNAERRQLTVMFCDLVGSTALASRLDPEDLREVIGAYHRCVAETVARFAGFVAKYMGDGVLGYFGYPQAHEDDAERAIRASLAVVEEVRRVASPERLQVRIGLATGLAVVGDLIGSGASQEQAVIGDTPNLAARLQSVASADQSSSRRIRDGWSVTCSITRASVRSRSKDCQRQCQPSASSERAESAVASRRSGPARHH